MRQDPGNNPGNGEDDLGTTAGTGGRSPDPVGSMGWVTTRQAARALGVQPRQVRNLISDGDLEAVTEGSGVNRRYLVSIASLEALRQKRRSEGKLPGRLPGNNRGVTDASEGSGQGAGTPAEGAPVGAAETADLLRELAAKLEDAQYELGRAEARLELTAQAESTLREALDRERERADRLEAELLETCKPLPGPRGAPEAASGGTDKGDVLPEPQEPVRVPVRSWWRRFFGFE